MCWLATRIVSDPRAVDPESQRLAEDGQRTLNWKRWGPYLSDRQWGTVREDYSATGDAWDYFPHDAARSRTYRWGEDGLLGITDRECRLCLAVALWNEQDPILKERLFGLAGNEGNHGEDVKELYYFLDATPTSSYLEALYKYPQRAFPYTQLLEENRRRGRGAPEYELLDTGVFDGNRYFDVRVEYAKAAPDDLWMRLTAHQPRARAGAAARAAHALVPEHLGLGADDRGLLAAARAARRGRARARPPRLAGAVPLRAGRPHPAGTMPELLFCDNETNAERLFDAPSRSRWPKDAIHDAVVQGRRDAVNPDRLGTKMAAHYRLELPPGGSATLRLRLAAVEHGLASDFDGSVDALFEDRRAEADAFYALHLPPTSSDEERRIARQAWAGLHWCKQYYHYSVRGLARGRPVRAGAPAREEARPQRALGPEPLQPRRPVDAGHLGVPLVRGVGPGVPHAAVLRGGPGLRQGAAHPAPARMVHAPQRAPPGVRVGVLGREPAGARLGLLAHLQEDRAARPPRHRRSSSAPSRSSCSTSPGG